jgi:hypothetical protein
MFSQVVRISRLFFYALAVFFTMLTLLLLIFRKDIENFAVQQLEPYIKVPVYIHDIDFRFWGSFPNFSLQLKGVLIKDYDPVFGQNSDTLLYAHKIILKANTWSLFKSDFSIQSVDIQKAKLGLRVDKNGIENFDIFIKDTTSKEKTGFEINLRRVLFTETDFSFINYQNNQEYRAYFDKLRLSGTFNDESFNMKLSTNFIINRYQDKSLTLLRKANVRLETDVAVDNGAVRYEIPNAIAEINKIPFNLNFFQDTNSFFIRLKAEKVPLEMVMESVHQKELNKLKSMSISGEADMTLDVNGIPKINHSPNIYAEFSVNKGKLIDQEQQLSVQNLSLKGKYKKTQGTAEVLEINSFDITTMGQTLRGVLSVVDFETPRIKTEAQGEINLKALHHFFPIPGVDYIGGKLSVQGNLQARVLNPGQKNQEIQLKDSKSDLDCKKIQLKLKSSLPEFSEINGKITTRNDDFVFDGFSIQTSGSKLLVSGKMDNLLDYLEREAPLNVNIAVDAERIDLNEFIKESNNVVQNAPVTDIGAYVLPKNISGQLEYDVKELVLGKHTFSKLLGIIILRNREMDFRKMQLEHVGSTILGDFKIHEKTPGTLDLMGDVSTKNIELKKLFAEWNNFDQENIKAENIAGNADVKLKFQISFSVNHGPVKETLNAQVNLKIVGGSLIQMEAMKEIASSMRSNDFVRVFLGKNLKTIEQKLEKLVFDNLENTFYISNSKFVIPKMTIRSNLMNLVVSGWQHFDESLEYHFEFDFKELKQQTRDTQFGEIKSDGISTRLFLKMFGTLSNLQFAWDSDAKKAYKQEQREQQKQAIKSVLKSEFGLFKKDTAAQMFQKANGSKEIITIDFGEENPPAPNVEKKKREINDKFNKIRKENQKKDDKVVIEFD